MQPPPPPPPPPPKKKDIRVFEEICADITVYSTNENDQQSSSDILEDENVQVKREPAFDSQIVDPAMNIHSKAGKLDDPVLQAAHAMILQCVYIIKNITAYTCIINCLRL